jgi:hypothetical protein
MTGITPERWKQILYFHEHPEQHPDSDCVLDGEEERTVMVMLAYLTDEVEALRKAMATSSFSPSLYEVLKQELATAHEMLNSAISPEQYAALEQERLSAAQHLVNGEKMYIAMRNRCATVELENKALEQERDALRREIAEYALTDGLLRSAYELSGESGRFTWSGWLLNVVRENDRIKATVGRLKAPVDEVCGP